MDAVTCKSKLLEDGHLALPRRVQKELRLQVGESVELVVRKRSPSTVRLEAALLDLVENSDATAAKIEQHVGRLTAQSRPSERLLKALDAIAKSKMPANQQRRLSTLLFKNREGELTPAENAELERLMNKESNGSLRKAHASLALHLLNHEKRTTRE